MIMEIIDLKKEPDLIEQYVELRNNHLGLLLASPVTPEGTREWLKKSGILIWGISENRSLLGAIVLYLDKQNEIAFFVKQQNKGVGTRLLDIAEDAAKKKGLSSIWAWVLEGNLVAQHVFEKSGFIKEKADDKYYEGAARQGVKYIKYLR